MARITPIHWLKFEKFLLSVGCCLVRTRGDHRMYDKPGLRRPIVIKAVKDLPVFIIKNNLSELKISPKQYLETMSGLK